MGIKVNAMIATHGDVRSISALIANKTGWKTAVWASSWKRGDDVWEERVIKKGEGALIM